MLYNRYAAPFLFLVTGLPVEFRKWLVFVGVHEVDSRLRMLFVENGTPIPHDYLVTLTNYNMRTDSDLLRERANLRVRKSVTDLLFDTPSDTSQRVAEFIRQFRDNLEETLSDDEARLFVQNSVLVDSLDVIVPGTKVSITLYNVYIHPPTANLELFERWRRWVGGQKFYAGTSGVGIRYQYGWHCIHCKTIDHPAGLCPFAKILRGKTGKQESTPAAGEDLFPLEPIPGPSRSTQELTREKHGGTRGNGKMPARTGKVGRQTRGIDTRTGSRKRKIN